MDLVYWDSNAFLGLIGGEPGKLQACEDVWKSGGSGTLKIVTSTLTTAEVIYSKGISKMDPKHRPKLNAWFRQAHIIQEPLTRVIAELARDVVWDHGIKAKDAVHIATAAFHKIPCMHTYDDQLLKLKSVTIAGFTFPIVQPHATVQTALDMGEESKVK